MSIREMAIIQPENKTLLVINNSGLCVDVDGAGDVVRGNVSQPSNGQYIYKFVGDTEITVDDGSSISSPISVTKDGSTYNDDLGGKGIDIVFQVQSSRGNQVRIFVSDTVSAKDNYLDKTAGSGRRNYGTCTTIQSNNGNPRNKTLLIKFTIPDVIKNVDNILDSSVFFYQTSVTGTDKMEMYAIHQDNSAWTEGTKCNLEPTNESTWTRIRFLDGDVNNGDFWVSGQGGCRIIGTDVESPILSNPPLGSSNSWIGFVDNSNNLISLVTRIVRSDGDNIGLMIRTEKNDSTAQNMTIASSEYTTDITFRPKMVISYEEISVEDGGVFPNYATSMGSEETFGGS